MYLTEMAQREDKNDPSHEIVPLADYEGVNKTDKCCSRETYISTLGVQSKFSR